MSDDNEQHPARDDSQDVSRQAFHRKVDDLIEALHVPVETAIGMAASGCETS